MNKILQLNRFCCWSTTSNTPTFYFHTYFRGYNFIWSHKNQAIIQYVRDRTKKLRRYFAIPKKSVSSTAMNFLALSNRKDWITMQTIRTLQDELSDQSRFLNVWGTISFNSNIMFLGWRRTVCLRCLNRVTWGSLGGDCNHNFWDVILFSLVEIYQHIRGLHLQDQRVKMKAIHSSKTSTSSSRVCSMSQKTMLHCSYQYL